VAKRFEHRPPRAEDAGLQFFDAEVETRIDHSRGCPNVVCERRFQERTAHDDLLSPTPDVGRGTGTVSGAEWTSGGILVAASIRPVVT
jgi:hypothetical protein